MNELLARLQKQAVQDDALLKKYAQQPEGITAERIREIKARFEVSAQLLTELARTIENHIEEPDVVGALQLEVAIIQFHSGCLYRALGDTQTALSRLQEALTRMAPAGPNYPLLVFCYARMADILSEQGKYQDSTQMYEKALESIDDSNFDPIEKGILLNNLAVNILQLQQPEKAFSYFHKAIASVSTGTDRNEEARIRNNFGIALSDADQFEQALAQHRKAFLLSQNFKNEEQRTIAALQIKLCEHCINYGPDSN